MNSKVKLLSMVVGAVLALAARAGDEPPQIELEEGGRPSRWHISAGVRLAPGVKTRAAVSSRAAVEAAGRLRTEKGSRSAALPSAKPQTSTTRSSETTTRSSSEGVAVTAESRLEFDNGFIDMADDAGVAGETSNWHFDDASALDESSGTITATTEYPAMTMVAPGMSLVIGPEVSASSTRTAVSETVAPDPASSGEDDLWGADLDVGFDLVRKGRFTLGFGAGATLYRGEEAVRAAGRCYAATSRTVRETRTGRVLTATTYMTEVTTKGTETTTFEDVSFRGASGDIRNADGSIGAGTPDGRTNPYGGNNPVLRVSDGSVTKTTTVETRKDTTVTTSRLFQETGRATRRTGARRTIDVAADGDVETQELRAALQPAWEAAGWLALRGSLGVVATRVSVDADATILVDGARFATVSGDDEDWVFSGFCGIDAVFRPTGGLELVLGGDIRLGDREMDYEAGLVRGTVELSRYTLRAAVGVEF